MMKAIIIEKPGTSVLTRIKSPTPKPHDILIKVMASGICGTDIHIMHGNYIADYPIIPGHEFSGMVEAIGAEVTRFKPGDRVSVEPNISCDNCYNCLNNRQNFCENWQAIGVTKAGGMAQYVVVPEKAAFHIHQLEFEHGAFMEPLSCVLHSLERINMQMANSAAILGAGPIGLLFLQAVRLHGTSHVTVLEKQTSRLKLAGQLSADKTHNEINKIEKNKFDLVIDATGVISVMEQAVDLVRPGGQVLLFGVPPLGEKLNIEGSKIFKKGLTIMTSYTSVRNSFQAVELLRTMKINVAGLISHLLPLSDFNKGVELIEKRIDNVNKVIILPQE